MTDSANTPVDRRTSPGSAIAPGVHMLRIRFDGPGGTRTIHPVLLQDDSGALALFDAGFAGQAELFHSAIREAGLDPADLEALFVTHLDRDHVGGAAELLALGTRRIEVYAHEVERPYLDGERIFRKKAPPGQESLPAPPGTPPLARVTHPLRHFEQVDRFGGVVAIHLPGHTEGHVAYLLEASGILVAGDALNIDGERLVGPNPVHTHDLDRALSSLGRLGSLPIRGIVAYHGGHLSGDPHEALEDLASRLGQ